MFAFYFCQGQIKNANLNLKFWNRIQIIIRIVSGPNSLSTKKNHNYYKNAFRQFIENHIILRFEVDEFKATTMPNLEKLFSGIMSCFAPDIKELPNPFWRFFDIHRRKISNPHP